MAGRRKIDIDDSSAWVFNRMAHVYDARPAYPAALVDKLVGLARRGAPSGLRAQSGSRAAVVDLGAGTGHLALPLAERGCQVFAVEPAHAMLARLRERAAAQGEVVHCLHAAAESIPLDTASIDLALVADALHFLDAALTGHEIGRVLKPHGALAVVTCELGTTAFMRDVVRIMEEAAPRRPRATHNIVTQIAGVAGITLSEELQLEDHTQIDHALLERILRSISFIGPAMNPQRFAEFWRRVSALSTRPIWSRSFKLRFGWRP